MRTVGATILRSRSQSCSSVSVVGGKSQSLGGLPVGGAYLAVVAVSPFEVRCEAPLVVCVQQSASCCR